MKKIVLAGIVIIIVLIVVSLIRFYVPSIEISTNNISNIETISSNKFIMDDIKTHNKEVDCWVGYDGKIYDISSFLPVHPGSAAAIIPYCGTSEEFTDAFTKQHGTSKVSKLMKVGVLIGDFKIQGKIK